MKNLITLIICLFCISSITAQIQLRPLPDADFEERITDYVNSMAIADSHEHLMSQESVKKSSMLDFMLLLHHYADDDIKSAGMGKSQFAELLTDKYSVIEKWELVKPFWEASINTAYCRTVLLAMDKLYGIQELNEETVIDLSKKIKQSYKTDWYDYVLKEKANIKYAVMDVGANRMEDDMFRYVEKFDEFIRIHSIDDINKIGKKYNLDVTTLDAFTKALETAFEQALKRNMVGIKSALAYHRILHYENVSERVADKLFSWIIKDNAALDFEVVKPLQDYMMHRIIQLARKHDLPMQIHTGFHAGDGNYISNSNPTLLTNLFLEYRDINFALFHGSYPYGGELATLAKSFRNVYLDMSWIYVISPSYAERYLHEWLEAVPSNKIMAFGGDYHNVENTYAHSLMARAIISKVLIEKVRTGYLTEEESKTIAKRLLYDNVVEFFRIE